MAPFSMPDISRRFPLLAHWSNLGAFGGMAAFASGICLAGLTPMRTYLLQGKLYPVYLPVAIVCIVAGVITGKKMIRFSVFGVAGAAMYLFQMAQCRTVDSCIAALPASPIRITGAITAPPQPRRDAFVFLLSPDMIAGKRHRVLSGRTFRCRSLQNPPAAGSLEIEGIVRPGERRKNRFDFDERDFFAANGIAGSIDVVSIVGSDPPRTPGGRIAAKFRSRLHAVLKQYPNPDHRALIRASFTGEKSSVAPEISESFRRSGLYHLLSLSGFHAAILLTAVYAIFALFPVHIVFKHVGAILVLWVYWAFIGPIPSLTRAVVMATAVIVSMMMQRKNYPLQTFGMAGLLWLVFSPVSLFQPGFQLSYGATFGILTVHPLLARLYPGCPNPAADYILRPLYLSLSVSCSAFCATLPILLYHFGAVSLYGFFANIAAIPLMSGAMWSFFTGLLTAAPFSAWVSRAAIGASGLMIDCLLKVAGWAGSVPFSLLSGYAPYPEIIVIFYGLLLAVITIDRGKRVTLLAWSIPLLLCAIPADYLLRRAAASPAIVRFATGRDAAITAVRWPRGATWLFCSGKEPSVRGALRNTVAGWIRHTPGTRVDRQFFTYRAKSVIDSGRIAGRRQYDNVDTFIVMQPAWACTCRFVPDDHRAALLVSCGTARLFSDHAGRALVVSTAGDSRKRSMEAPAEGVIRKHRWSVRRFD